MANKGITLVISTVVEPKIQKKVDSDGVERFHVEIDILAFQVDDLYLKLKEEIKRVKHLVWQEYLSEK